MNSLVIGRGEVGQALIDILHCRSYDIADEEPWVELPDIDVLHIAIPWSDKFSQIVRGYRSIVDPDLIIVYSTVPVGTCEDLGVVHSPVEGQHPGLAKAIRVATCWLGSSDSWQLSAAVAFWAKHVSSVRSVNGANITEYLKLRSTARYGINIAFANYEADVARDLGIDYNLVGEFDRDYNHLYRMLGVGGHDVSRYVLTDPHNHIGGHCIVPNAKLLAEQYPSSMLQEIIRLG